MKKLTAGIFSVLMGLVSVNAADAAVASKGYVDTKVGLNTEAINALNTKVGEKDVATQISEATSSLSSDTTDLKTRMSTAESGLSAVQELSAINEAAIETLDAAYKAADTALDGRVTANEGAITGLQSSKADKGSTLAAYGIKDAYTKTETDAEISEAVKGAVEGDVSEILVDYLTRDDAETTYETIAAAKATNDAQDAKITDNTNALTVLNGNASVNGSVAKSISDALVPYSTTDQVQGFITIATTDMATNASVDTALSNYTNTTDLTALLNAKQDNLSGSDAVKIDNNVVSIIAGSITGAMITDLTIDTDDIANGAVTTDKLAGGSVTAEKLGAGAVGDNAVSALSQSKITGLEDALSAKFVAPAYEAVTDNGTYVLTATKVGNEIQYAWEDITRN